MPQNDADTDTPDSEPSETAPFNVHRRELEATLERCLLVSEQVVWRRCEKPPAGSAPKAGDGCSVALLTFFMLFCLLFLALMMFLTDSAAGGLFVLMLSGVFGWSSWRYIAAGAAKKQSPVLTVITNERLLVIAIDGKRHVKSIYPPGLQSIDQHERADGTTDFLFGDGWTLFAVSDTTVVKDHLVALRNRRPTGQT